MIQAETQRCTFCERQAVLEDLKPMCVPCSDAWRAGYVQAEIDNIPEG